MNHLSNEQITAIIDELKSWVVTFKVALENEKKYQEAYNHSLYEGRKEVTMSVIDMFERQIKEYSFELEDRKERESK